MHILYVPVPVPGFCSCFQGFSVARVIVYKVNKVLIGHKRFL